MNNSSSNMPRRNTNWLASIFILIVGLAVICGGILFLHQLQIPKSYVHTTSTVTNADYTGQNDENLYAKFSVNGQSYNFTSTVSRSAYLHNSTYFIGSTKLKIAYNPANPAHDIKNISYKKNSTAFAVIFIIVGCLFAIIGFLAVITSLVNLFKNHS
jgi:hypothetical protein